MNVPLLTSTFFNKWNRGYNYLPSKQLPGSNFQVFLGGRRFLGCSEVHSSLHLDLVSSVSDLALLEFLASLQQMARMNLASLVLGRHEEMTRWLVGFFGKMGERRCAKLLPGHAKSCSTGVVSSEDHPTYW